MPPPFWTWGRCEEPADDPAFRTCKESADDPVSTHDDRSKRESRFRQPRQGELLLVIQGGNSVTSNAEHRRYPAPGGNLESLGCSRAPARTSWRPGAAAGDTLGKPEERGEGPKPEATSWPARFRSTTFNEERSRPDATSWMAAKSKATKTGDAPRRRAPLQFTTTLKGVSKLDENSVGGLKSAQRDASS